MLEFVALAFDWLRFAPIRTYRWMTVGHVILPRHGGERLPMHDAIYRMGRIIFDGGDTVWRATQLLNRAVDVDIEGLIGRLTARLLWLFVRTDSFHYA